MITDKETNLIYISDLLENRCPNVFRQLTAWFDKLHIKWGILPNTKDIWAVDFMPLQIQKDHFLQFEYNPDYLKLKKYAHTKTDPEKVCHKLGIQTDKTDIVLDGGNIVKTKTKAILTSKIFKENRNYSEDDLIAKIKSLLQVEQIVIVPQEPGDFIGHADGMVRFIDENSVLMN
jgi:agmatine deiminase